MSSESDVMVFTVRQTVKATRTPDGLSYHVWNDDNTTYTVVPAATFEAVYAAMPVALPTVPPQPTMPTSAHNR